MTPLSFYAERGGTCFKFAAKGPRDYAVTRYGLISLSAADAMKKYGYTDSCSRRVVNCVTVPVMATSEELAKFKEAYKWLK